MNMFFDWWFATSPRLRQLCWAFWLLMFVAPLLLAVGITLILRLTGSAEARIDAVLLQAEQQLARSLQITKPRLLERQQLREQRLQRQR